MRMEINSLKDLLKKEIMREKVLKQKLINFFNVDFFSGVSYYENGKVSV